MRPSAIVYTSNTGHTRRYSLLLGDQLGLPVYSLDEAKSQLSDGCPVICLGRIHASRVKGYSKSASRFSVCAVCGLWLCDNGTLTSEVRKATSIPDNIPLFTLRGGIDRSKLKGVDKLMISMLTKGLAAQKQRSEQGKSMLELLGENADYVKPENFADVLKWYRENG